MTAVKDISYVKQEKLIAEFTFLDMYRYSLYTLTGDIDNVLLQ
jgi:hypothetical protein